MHCAVTFSLAPTRTAMSRTVRRAPPRAATLATIAANSAFARGVSGAPSVSITSSSLRPGRHPAHLTLHAEESRRLADETAGQGHRLRRVAGDRHTNEVVGGDQAVGRIELDPAGAGQID